MADQEDMYTTRLKEGQATARRLNELFDRIQREETRRRLEAQGPTIFDWSISRTPSGEFSLHHGDRSHTSIIDNERCWIFKGYRYGVPWRAYAWAVNYDEAMRQARAVFGNGLYTVPDVPMRELPLQVNFRHVVLERERLPLYRQLRFWIDRFRLGFEQEDFRGRRQLLRVWRRGRTWWEVWEWGPDETAQSANAWLDRLPKTALSERYERLRLSATQVIKTTNFGQALAHMREGSGEATAINLTLLCGCRGVICRSSGPEERLYIATVIQYCEHHPENWYRGFALPDGYFERKIDHDLVERLATALSAALLGEPIDDPLKRG